MLGIVNVTPDSFYDQGATEAAPAAVARGLELLAAGAGALDVGGMTAQPGAPISEAEEIARVVPVIAELRAQTDAVISVDTYRAAVAAAALAAGADLVNDHTGLSDPAMAGVVAQYSAGLVITHLGLAPKAARSGTYAVAPGQIFADLDRRALAAVEAGVRSEAILVDPGLGFGKDTATDLDTLRRLPELVAQGRPVLLAPSHKEVTADPLGLPESSLEGTAAVVAVAAAQGVHMLRLHDLPFMAAVAHMGWLLGQPAEGGVSDRSKKDARNAPSR